LLKASRWAGLRKPQLLLRAAILGNVHDLVFEDEQVGRTFARQAHHVLVVILNPSVHRLPVHQLDAYRPLLLPQAFEKSGFLESLFRRRSPATLAGVRAS